jgi:hypothetical protein
MKGMLVVVLQAETGQVGRMGIRIDGAGGSRYVGLAPGRRAGKELGLVRETVPVRIQAIDVGIGDVEVVLLAPADQDAAGSRRRAVILLEVVSGGVEPRVEEITVGLEEMVVARGFVPDCGGGPLGSRLEMVVRSSMEGKV